MSYEKNIAALLREDAKTIRVRFGKFNPIEEGLPEAGFAGGEGRLYSYVTHLDIEVGDVVLVEAANEIKTASVVEVDDTVKVEPGSAFALRWVILKVNLTEHFANLEKNKKIEELVQEAYQKNLRRSFAQQLLSGVDDDARNNLQKLLGGSK